LLLVEDIQTVKQCTSAVTVAFDDQAVADFFEDQVAFGRKPAQFARIWIHSHPGNSAQPSSTDEETFGRVFGTCDWAIMFILAKGGQTYTRLRFNAGPGGEIEIPCGIDFSQHFEAADPIAWQSEYEQNVHAEVFEWGIGALTSGDLHEGFGSRAHRFGLRESTSLEEDVEAALWAEYAEHWDMEREVLE